MLLLTLFAFLAGVVTVLSPCILPLLPIILSSANGQGKQRPLGVVTGFVASFTFFTLFLSTLVRLSGIPAESLRFFSIVVLIGFGLSLLVSQVQAILETLFSKLAGFAPNGAKYTGFMGGLVVGMSLGLLWTPCVGPILASVISLSITGEVSAQAFILTLAYSLGTALPMLAIMLAGSTALQKVPWLVRNTGRIQKTFGVVMIVTGAALFWGVDRQFQTFILNTFPNYGVGLTKFEDNEQVKAALETIDMQSQPMPESEKGQPMQKSDTLKGPRAREFVAGGEWFNTEPLTLASLRGKVVLVDFWTYSCINCQRTLPYLKQWWQKYQDKGLVIVGVHSPEFEFEKKASNVQQALTDFAIAYPVMQDNEFTTWRSYNNRYWPAKYLIDKDGAIRYTHFGEGKYDETEKMIQKLLEETGSSVEGVEVSNTTYSTYARTPELYLGYDRLEHLTSPERVIPDAAVTFSALEAVPNNTFAYEGSWIVMPEYAAPAQGSTLLLNFEAKEVFLVARPKDGNTAKSGIIKVYLDHQLQAFGEDNQNGVVTVTQDDLYKLINLPKAGRHELRLEFLDGELELYAFTFG
jgi:cytochrome c biogenesis protein CcdA/thiol-disulfide isomerase/thioredoxin